VALAVRIVGSAPRTSSDHPPDALGLVGLREPPQDRGRGFKRFLTKLLELFDLEPRLAHSLASEQIDGSVTFDTDDHIVEARWTKDPVGRDVDVFASKARRKGKNALGLLVSVSGFTRGALDAYSRATPFMAMDGVDLMAVLGQQVRLYDDEIR